MPKNDLIWPENGIFVHFGLGLAGSFGACWWVGWWLWRAGCISKDTYLLYNNDNNNNNDHHDDNNNYYHYRRLASFVKILNQEDISKHQNHDTIQEVGSSNQEYLTL